MTPMVDLAFLLLTFFILTSTFAKSKATDLSFPAKPKDDQPISKDKANGITILLGENNKVYWYPGALTPDKVLTKADYSSSKDGLRAVFSIGNKKVYDKMQNLKADAKKWTYKDDAVFDSIYKYKSKEIKGGEDALVVIVKADDKASYKNVIDVVDELNISEIGKFVIVDMTPEEKAKLDALK
jgi:biopolymer transport protein ExbD